MKKMVIFWLLVLLITQTGFAAGERFAAGGRSLALGSASVALCDLWSLCNNQAGAAWLKRVSVGLGFENRFLLKELMYKQVGFALPLKAGTIGLVANHSGTGQYSEMKAGLSFARKFGKYFSVGIQLTYLRIHISEDYGNKNLVSCEIGLMYHADRHLTVGVQLLNPVPVKINDYPMEQLPGLIVAGISYSFSRDFMATLEAEKDLEHPLILRAGAEYHMVSHAYARIGISTNPTSFSFGFGLEFGRITIDMASGYHQALGFSPSGSVIYSFR